MLSHSRFLTKSGITPFLVWSIITHAVGCGTARENRRFSDVVPRNTSYLVCDREWGVIGPAFVIRGSLVDDESACGLRQLGRGELVVDSPADIVVESAPSLAPPGVWPLNVAGQRTHHIHELVFVQPFVHVGTFFGQKSGVLLIGLGVLDIKRRPATRPCASASCPENGTSVPFWSDNRCCQHAHIRMPR